MATVRKMWSCKTSTCKNPETGKHRGYKKVCAPGEKKALCKWCAEAMVLNESHTARVQVGGTSITRTISPNKKDAEAYISECKSAQRTGNLLPGEEVLITWKDAIKRFNVWLDDPGANEEISDNTVTHYRAMLKPMEKYFGKMDLQSIQKKDVDAFKSARMKTHSASTVNGSLATLKRLYSVICGQERASLTPRLHEAKTDIFKVKLLIMDNQVETILETEEEMRVLLSFCRTPHLYHFCFGVMNTGLRHADMLKLRIEEISFPKNEITTVVKGQTKVTIPLTATYRAYLEDWIKGQRVRAISGYLIPSKLAGRCYESTSKIGFDTACEKAAEHFEKIGDKSAAKRFRALTPHCLRHTFATHFLYKSSKSMGATAAVHVLSKILGHSSTYITERYSHALRDVQQSAMADFGAQMFTKAESR